jgi:NADPH:quinone reductase-like Zn-dependent oxidoreductase
MKAVVCEKYGPPDVLEIREMEKPLPGDKEVLIRNRATTVNAADCNTRGLTHIPPGLGLLARLMLGFNKPRKSILGSVVAGEIEAVGKDVESFSPGDRVYGTGPELGGYAEFACRPEDGALAIIPEQMTYEQAATLPYGALTALYFLKDIGNISKGQKVLIMGASGGVGVFAVQLAKYFGAEVTGVCSTRNVEFVKFLGADNVIDYKQKDLTGSIVKWDIIFDVIVGKTSFSRYKHFLSPNGYYLAVAGGLQEMIQMIWTSMTGGRKVKFGGGEACETKENLEFLNELYNAGRLSPYIDRTFPLEEIVEAHSYVESGQKKGNVVVTLT